MESISIEFNVRHRVIAQITALPAFFFACRLRAHTHQAKQHTRQTDSSRPQRAQQEGRAQQGTRSLGCCQCRGLHGGGSRRCDLPAEHRHVLHEFTEAPLELLEVDLAVAVSVAISGRPFSR